MLKDNTIYVYVFSNDSLDNDISLPDSLLSNINKYKDINKRNIKLTKYNRLLKTNIHNDGLNFDIMMENPITKMHHLVTVM